MHLEYVTRQRFFCCIRGITQLANLTQHIFEDVAVVRHALTQRVYIVTVAKLFVFAQVCFRPGVTFTLHAFQILSTGSVALTFTLKHLKSQVFSPACLQPESTETHQREVRRYARSLAIKCFQRVDQLLFRFLVHLRVLHILDHHCMCQPSLRGVVVPHLDVHRTSFGGQSIPHSV